MGVSTCIALTGRMSLIVRITQARNDAGVRTVHVAEQTTTVHSIEHFNGTLLHVAMSYMRSRAELIDRRYFAKLRAVVVKPWSTMVGCTDELHFSSAESCAQQGSGNINRSSDAECG